jgi:hypothetical protein
VTEQTIYRNLWYGLTLTFPTGWQVRQAPGCILVSPDAGSLTCAMVRFFATDAGMPLRQVAEQVVGLLRKADPSVQAWAEQPGDGITVHLTAVLNGTPVQGSMLLQARGGSVLATGLQAPASELASRTPALAEILASLRFEQAPQLRRFDDSAEHSFGGYAPQDWTVQAVLQRSPTPQRIPLPVLSAVDPTGQMSLQVPPSYEQYSERPVPGGMLQFAAYPGVAGYLRLLAGGPLSRERPGAHFGDIIAEPDFAAYERAQSAPGVPFEVESASIMLTYDQGAVLYREAVTATLVHYPNLGTWSARVAARRSAPADSYGAADTIFCGILQSISPDRQWASNEQARANQILNQSMGNAAQAQSDYLSALRNLGQVRSNAAASLAGDATGHMNTFLQEQQLHVMPALRGDQIMVNPADGTRVEVPSVNGTYWADPARRVYLTPDPGTQPVPGAERLEPI